MVFGNMGDDSGTGRRLHPRSLHGRAPLLRRVAPNAQGEDVVAGIRTPHPVSKGGGDDKNALEVVMPTAYAELAGI